MVVVEWDWCRGPTGTWGYHDYSHFGDDGSVKPGWPTTTSGMNWDWVEWGQGEGYVFIGFAGDLNEDGFVGQSDLDIVLAMWGNSGPDITDLRADVNTDNFVGQTDLDYVLADWGQGTPPGSPVPEPVTLSLLALGAAAVLRRRR